MLSLAYCLYLSKQSTLQFISSYSTFTNSARSEKYIADVSSLTWPKDEVESRAEVMVPAPVNPRCVRQSSRWPTESSIWELIPFQIVNSWSQRRQLPRPKSVYWSLSIGLWERTNESRENQLSFSKQLRSPRNWKKGWRTKASHSRISPASLAFLEFRAEEVNKPCLGQILA